MAFPSWDFEEIGVRPRMGGFYPAGGASPHGFRLFGKKKAAACGDREI